MKLTHIIACLLFLAVPAGAQLSVPASRLAHLRPGINASEWFALVYDPRGYTKEHFQNWRTAREIIRNLCV